MTAGIIYNVSFTAPAAPSGYSRNLLDPEDGFYFRAEEYQWNGSGSTL